MTVEMYPPSTAVPFKKFKLASTGREVEPDFDRDGLVIAKTDAEVFELEREGWSRVASKLDVGTLQKVTRDGFVVAPAVELRDQA